MSIYGNIVGGNIADAVKKQVSYAGTFTTALPTQLTENGVLRPIRKGDYVIAGSGVAVQGYYQGDWAVYNGSSWNRVNGATLATVARSGSYSDLINKPALSPPNAEENIINSITINGIPQTVTNKVVDLPIALANRLGLVKGSADANKISIAGDGTMEVNSLNVNKLIQTDGDELILFGGNS